MMNRRLFRRSRRDALRVRRRDDAGLSTVESVLTVPLLVLMIFTVIQVGMWWYARQIALSAAQDAARTARAYQSTAAAGTARGYEYVDNVQGDGTGVLTNVVVTTTRTADTVTVRVTGQVTTLVPGLTLTVDEQSTGPTEKYVPSQ